MNIFDPRLGGLAYILRRVDRHPDRRGPACLAEVRYGSGDRKGAFKLSLVILAAAFAGYFLSMPHVPAFFPELTRATHALRESLGIAVITWVIYWGARPIVRRNMPDLLVSWNRLMAGDWNDPLIGRDILFGTLFGLGHFSLILSVSWPTPGEWR